MSKVRFSIAAFLWVCSVLPVSSAVGSDDLWTRVQPILVRQCWKCHGKEKQEGDLRLDQSSEDSADLSSVIRPGEPDASELLKRITATDDTRMPPMGAPLSTAEIELFRGWILAGAAGSDSSNGTHWAFVPIRRHTGGAAVGNTGQIDEFVVGKLRDHGHRPAPAAQREQLVRRLSLDLLGLPPRAEDLRNADGRPGWYSQLVDKYLSDPAFGERWGRHLLDVARYSNSSGYEADTPRQIWAYRDWVINSINRNDPFDQFVIEQLAGDLMPTPTVDQRIATGFASNGMLDPGLRWESIMDQVDLVGAGLLGLTVGCARCHDHKTDPLSQEEFYQLFAFFNEANSAPFEFEREGEKLQSLSLQSAPQPTHVFVRGDPTQPGQQVATGTPKFLPPLTPRNPSAADRLDLAKWLFLEDHPLTSRVTVNRIWQRLFGRGLVAAENDFGRQSPPPTHPELLDYLAQRFIETGWDRKRLIREIVRSSTYRQDSLRREDPDAPENELLGRQLRVRLEAEIVRDIALSVSGLLSREFGGPSVFPHQADGVLDFRATPAKWEPSPGNGRYRRGLYTWNWRLTPHPHTLLFDGPDGTKSCTCRNRTIVPTQALTRLNDPMYFEAATALRDRLARHSDLQLHIESKQRVRQLYLWTLSRIPSESEEKVLLELLAAEEFSGHPDRAWLAVCRVLLNLDELIVRP